MDNKDNIVKYQYDICKALDIEPKNEDLLYPFRFLQRIRITPQQLNYLSSLDLINRGFCPDCGRFPIGDEYHRDRIGSKIVQYLCRDCWEASNPYRKPKYKIRYYSAKVVSEVVTFLGWCLKVMSDFISTCTIIIGKGQPHNSQTDVDKYYNQGCICMEKGKYNRAIDAFTQILLIDPCCAKAYYHRGRVFSIKGNLELALNDAKGAKYLKPDRPEYVQFVKDLDLQIVLHYFRDKSEPYTDEEKLMFKGYLLKHDESFKKLQKEIQLFESINNKK